MGQCRISVEMLTESPRAMKTNGSVRFSAARAAPAPQAGYRVITSTPPCAK